MRPHCDGAYETPDGKERSYFTLHLYLNDATVWRKRTGLGRKTDECRRTMRTPFIHRVDRRCHDLSRLQHEVAKIDVFPKTGRSPAVPAPRLCCIVATMSYEACQVHDANGSHVHCVESTKKQRPKSICRSWMTSLATRQTTYRGMGPMVLKEAASSTVMSKRCGGIHRIENISSILASCHHITSTSIAIDSPK